MDFTKVCDTVERLPPLRDTDLTPVVLSAWTHWTTKYSYFDPNTDQTDRLGLSHAREGGVLDHMHRVTENTALRHMAHLLQTPRELKRVVQRVDAAWDSLHGEVGLVDLLIVTTLRESQPRVYEFLLSHIDAARMKTDGGLVASIESDWKQSTKAVGMEKAVTQFVALLDIEQLTGSPSIRERSRQGVHLSDPTDYFSRITAEQLNPDELRDQTVLSDIDAWQHGRTNALVERLIASRRDDRRYTTVWEHFAYRHTPIELVRLTSCTVRFLLKSASTEATMNHPALLALSQQCHSPLQGGHNKDWLQTLILEAVPQNLQFATELYTSFCRWRRLR